jgi:DNA-binding NarL/FixJ family response regulator
MTIMDIHLPDMEGTEATRRLLKVHPSAKVLIFSSDPSRTLVDEALHAGACGYILKTGAVEELLDAIDTVMTGKLYLSRELSAGILEDYRKGLNEEAKPSKPLLSDRDKQLLRLITEGRRNKEIAVDLAVSVKSVEAFRSRLMKKVNCASVAELVRYAVREGIGPA